MAMALDDLVYETIRTSFGHEFGPIVDMSFFPRAQFTNSRLAFINFSDGITNLVHRGESRYMGGVYGEHPKDMLQLYFEMLEEIAKENDIQVSPYLIFINALNQHDVLEDYKGIEDLRNKLKDAKEEEIDGIIGQIKKERLEFVRDHYQHQNITIKSYTDTDDTEKLKLIMDGAVSLGVTDWLTRHTEEKYFHASIYYLCRMHTREEYSSGERGGPFQADLMDLLNVPKNGFEPMDYFLMRIFAKSLDRIALSRERKPRFTDEEAGEIEDLFQKNEWLANIYGEGIDFRGNEMPRPYNLNILYRNFIVLHNTNLALHRYGLDIVEEREENPVTYKHLLGIVKARKYLMEENREIISELKPSYELDLKKEHIGSVQERLAYVERINPLELERVSGDGSISRGFRYDTIYRNRWGDLDKEELDRVDNYRDVLGFEKLLERFLDPQRNKIDLNEGIFDLFTIRGVTDKLDVSLDPRPYSSSPAIYEHL